MNRAPFLLVLLALTPHLSAQDEKPQTEFERGNGKVRVRVKETIIGFNDPAMNEESFVSGPGGKRVAYMVMAGDGLSVVVDGVKGESFEGIAAGSLVFSPDGAHLAYVGTRPGRQCVVLDGKVYEYKGITKQGVVFSADGSRSGWVAVKDGSQIAVVDGVESTPYEGIGPQGVVFSADGRRHAFAAMSAGKFLVVLDGEEGPLFDSVADLRFTARGIALYVGIKDKKWYGVIDGVPYGPYDELRSLGSQGAAPSGEGPTIDAFEISADGSRVGFVATRGEEWFAIVDGKEHGPYQRCAGLALSPEGSRMAFLATRGEGWVMVVDGEEHSGRALESLSFSPDGKRLASIVRRGDRRAALIDGVEGKEYDKIEHPGIRFSSDGTRTAYLAELEGEKLVVVDGVEGPRFRRLGKTPLGWVPNGSRVMYSIAKGPKLEALVIGSEEGPTVESYRSLTFSADGERYIYVAEKSAGRFVIVLDGVEYGPGGPLQPGETRAYTKVAKGPPTFSADGKRVAWVAVTEQGWVATVDGKESRPYNVVMRSAVDFTPDGKHVVFVAAREGKNMIIVDDFEIENDWGPPLRHSGFEWDGPRRFSIRGSRDPRYLLIEVEIL